MRWLWLIILPAALAVACVESKDPVYDLDPNGNTGPTGPKCHPVNGIGPFSTVNGECIEADGGDGIVVAPVSVPVDGDGGVTATVSDAGISIPTVDAPPSFAYVWVANTSNGTVSKVDVTTLKEVGRYQSTRVCSNTTGATPFDDATSCNVFNPATQTYPSRTAIDGNQDAWVANRAFGAQASVSKIASDVTRCVERNGTAGIQTSNSATVVAGDECTLFTVPVGGKKDNAVARAIAVGPEDNDSGSAGSVWVGLYYDTKAVKLRNRDGKTLATYSVNVNTYGAAIDRAQSDGSYHVWYVGNGPTAIQFVKGGKDNCSSGSCVSAKFNLAPAGCADYGMAIDARNRVYVQSSSCNRTYQFTPNDTYTGGVWHYTDLPGVNQGRGVTVQVIKEQIDDTHFKEHSHMWVTNYDQWAWSDWQKSFATTFDGDKLACDADLDGVKDASCDYNKDGLINWKDYDVVSYWMPNATGASPIGIGVDPIDPRYIWTANQNATVSRLDSKSGTYTMDAPTLLAATKAWVPDATIAKVGVGPGPYTYSDFTGSARAQITSRHGSARMIYAGGCADGEKAQWTQLDWTSSLPSNTHIEFNIKVADKDYNGDGQIDTDDVDLAPAIGPFFEFPATPDPPGLHNDSPVNLTAKGIADGAYVEVTMDLYSSAQDSPLITGVNLHRTCN